MDAVSGATAHISGDSNVSAPSSRREAERCPSGALPMPPSPREVVAKRPEGVLPPFPRGSVAKGDVGIQKS